MSTATAPGALARPALLAAMDRNMAAMNRLDARVTAGGFVHEHDGLVCLGHPHGTVLTNMAIVTGPLAAVALRAHAAAAFAPAALPWSAWTRAHADAALEQALPEAGFFPLAEVPGMALVGAGAEPATPKDVVVRAVADARDVTAYRRVMLDAWSVYGVPAQSTAARFASLAGLAGAAAQAFLAWRGGEAVAGAVLYPADGLAGVGWVGTVGDAQGRGYGAAVTWAVVAEGRRRGLAAASLQASPMGEPVYRRMGFETPTYYRVWLPG
ncbi:MAG: GNAT family N-acetyltransferase [bacterium]|nr:GNAT family N-acetyltransferase [bacterium]